MASGDHTSIDLLSIRHFLVDGAIVSFLAPIPALASLFLVWVARRNRQQVRQHIGAHHRGTKGKASLQRRLIVIAHVILWSTFLSFLCGAITTTVLGFYPSSVPTPRPISRLLGGVLACNAIATTTFQSTGEGVLVYQFLHMYPDSKPRYRVLPFTALLILIRFVSQTFNQVLHVALTIYPNSDAMTSWLEWQTAGAWIYSISLMALILLLSASFVFKLWSRWREYRDSTRHRRLTRSHSSTSYTKLLPNSMHRIRGVLAATWHHTVLSSVSVIVMTVSFSFASSSEIARWVNAIFISVYKLVFSLGIAQSLYHVCFDATTLFHPLAANLGVPVPQHIQAMAGPADDFGSDATLPLTVDPSFRYNSWDSRSVALGTVPSESIFEPAIDSRSGYYARRGDGVGYESSWPIQSTNIESDLGLLGHHHPSNGRGYTQSQPRRARSSSGYRR